MTVTRHVRALDARQARCRVMDERRLALLFRLRQRHPGLDAVRPRTAVRVAHLRRRALGVHDAASRHHPVHVARADHLLAAEAVAVHERAFEQVGDGREADVRVGPHVHALPRAEFGRTHVIEENERTHRLQPTRRQRAPHGKVTEVARARFEHALDDARRSGHLSPSTALPWLNVTSTGMFRADSRARSAASSGRMTPRSSPSFLTPA